MKLLPTLLAGAAMLFTACEPATFEHHSTYFYPQTPYDQECYADQSKDSTIVVSYDSWTLRNECTWADVCYGTQKNNIYVEIMPGYGENSKLYIDMQPNTTGKARSLMLTVNSSYNKIGSVHKRFIQLPYHHVVNPRVKRETGEDGYVCYTFPLELLADGYYEGKEKGYITFTPYTNDARLVSDSPWLRPEKTTEFKANRTEKVMLDCDPNTTAAPRTATVSLISGEGETRITTLITVTQSC